MLRATLRALQAEYLPSDVMYLPIGKRPSRVVGIVADDSFCFKTNTRVPYLVCLEVVDDVGSFNDDGTFDTPGPRESDPSQTEKKSGVQRQASGDLGDRIKSRLGQLKTSLQRHLSTSSQLSAGGVMLQTFSTTESVGSEYHDFGVPSRPTSPGSSHGADEDLRARRSRAGSFDEARLGLERAKQFTAHTKDPSKQMARTPRRSADDAVLGQWTPRSVAANDLPGGGRGAGFSHFVHHKDFDFEDQRDTAREKLAAQGAERSREASFASSTEGNFVEIELSSHASARMPPSARSYGSEDSMLRALNDGEDFSTLKDAPTVVVPSDEPSMTPTYHHDEKENHWADEAQSDRDALVPSASRVAFANGIGGDEPVFDDEGDLEKMHGHAGDGDDHAADDDDDDEATGKSQTVIFRERWADKTKRVAAQSRWSHLPSWSIVPIIVKSDDDLRQEQFAAQLIALFDSVYREDGLPLRLHPYDVLAVSPDSGLIQAVPDTISLDSLKKNDTDYTTLRNFFIRYFGRPKSPAFKRAQSNFCESLAAYCIVCYLLQIKDRHNGNLLINAEGHIVHIDFGYLLSSQGPGNMNFERDVPFKITSEFVQLLDGPDSALFRRFRTLCCKAFLAARKRREQFILMIEMMLSNEADLDCFQAGGEETIRQLNERFQVGKSTAACITFVNDLIDVSINHYRTWLYDVYQRLAVGIKY
ncbi:Phosphatidylinositol 4-kinase [Hondaea fermentalgiana]|uniref:1-phosphatidylinositol 4-kinase n=1 Tax=Hondaea fermentalgiana TaxID=2315210 RepID=A0A2R5GVL6_9STRA|nr:Phosphatidylinositol 4-kinase [Hondaea fermentalgiana]|eukprot:GBG34892.1 Phosphatidylinositol 4-kinase [Hondaea fermentalgiana]